MKKSLFATLIASSFLAACGGGGGGGNASIMPDAPSTNQYGLTLEQVRDGVGTRDAYTGQQRIDQDNEEYFRENCQYEVNDGYYQTIEACMATRTDDAYAYEREVAYRTTNVRGLEEVHSQGWTGYGKTIAIYNEQFESNHYYDTEWSAETVAPGATVQHNNSQNHATNADVTSHSYGVGLFQEDINANGEVSDFWVQNATDIVLDIQAAADANPNALNVISAPNTGNCSPVINGVATTTANCDAAAIAYQADELEGEFLFVGAGTGASENNLNGHAYTSTAAGAGIADDFIVADGVASYSYYEEYEEDEAAVGTSFAGPKVAGAAALVMHKFETNAATTKSILLDTADDTFENYSLEQHGQGLLDIGAALSPVGNLR